MRAAVLAALAVCAAELAGTLVADAAPADTADTPTPLTPVPQTSAPPTYAPPTEAPPTPVPHTAAPPTDSPLTPTPPTPAPPTDAPATYPPGTAVPTSTPGTDTPLTPTPPTPAPPTYAPDTYPPGTAVPTYTPGTDTPLTLMPPTPAPLTVHSAGDTGYVFGKYSTPQEWVISCTPDSTLMMDMYYTPPGHSLTLDGQSLSSGYQPVTCPSSGKMSLLYTPQDNGNSPSIGVLWYAATAAPSTWSPATPSPPTPLPPTSAPPTYMPATSLPGTFTSAPVPPTVHKMGDSGYVSSSYSTPQEWLISCRRQWSMWMGISSTPSGYTFKRDGISMGRGYHQPLYCPSSGKVSLLYTPYDGNSHTLSFSWYTVTYAPGTWAPPTPAPPTPAPPTPSPVAVHYKSDRGSVYSSYSIPQEWVISCTRYSTIWMDLQYAPSGYTLMFDGSSIHSDQHVTCPYSGKLSLRYTPYDGYSHTVRLQWYPGTATPWSTWTPMTPAPPAPTVHYVSDHDSVHTTSSTPQEWVISCTRYSTLLMDISYTPSGYSITLGGNSMYSGYNQRVSCPSSGKVSLLYTPYDGLSHTLKVSWQPVTYVPGTLTPGTRVPPTPSPVTVHYMRDHDAVYSGYSTPQEWFISCTRYSTIWIDITYTPSGYDLTLDGKPMYSGSNQRVTCPSSGKMSLLYTPWDGNSHTLRFAWHTATSVPSTSIPSYQYTRVPSGGSSHHIMSDHGYVYSSYSTAQEWVITCTPYSYVDVTVTQLPGTLTADTTTLYRGQTSVHCPYTGQAKLSYIPFSGTSQPLDMSWAPEGGAHKSQSLSPLLIAVLATVGVLVLVGVTVAVYCGCRGQAADRKAYSSNMPYEGYADVGPTGGFDLVQDSCSSPEGNQPMNEMEEQLLVVDDSPVM